MLNSDTASKCKWSIEIMTSILLNGGDKVIPGSYSGTSDRIVNTSELGLRDIFNDWGVQAIDRSKRKKEKIIVFTTFAKFHPYLIAVCFAVLSGNFG